MFVGEEGKQEILQEMFQKFQRLDDPNRKKNNHFSQVTDRDGHKKK